LNAALRHIRHVALDMDGTIYRGNTLFGQTIPFLDTLQELSIGHTFLTNNSSKSTNDYLSRLKEIGIEARPDQLYTSSQATMSYLRQNQPNVNRLFLLGTPSLGQELTAAGFVLTRDDAMDEPDAVLAGFDTSLTFSRLCRAAFWIKQGKPFLATHPDRVCPTDAPTILVDCGSVCRALEESTGRAPDVIMGKPNPRMLHGILERHHLETKELAMVGDRLYTDMVMARRTGCLGVLVLTGETTRVEAVNANPAPDLVVEDLAELGSMLEKEHGKTLDAA
jgi:HAD superfamily hydrolase (TIGR01450 family)